MVEVDQRWDGSDGDTIGSVELGGSVDVVELG